MQEHWFAAQIELAEELQLPLFLHCRDAWQRFAEILRWVLAAAGGRAADWRTMHARLIYSACCGLLPPHVCAHEVTLLEDPSPCRTNHACAGRTGAECPAWHTASRATRRSWSCAWSWGCTSVRLLLCSRTAAPARPALVCWA